MKKPSYPILAQLMAKHGVSRNDISDAIGVSYRNTLKKINGETGFDLIEAGKVTKIFKDLGETVSAPLASGGQIHDVIRPIMIDDIFFA